MMFAGEAKEVWSEVAIIVDQVESISVVVINSLTPAVLLGSFEVNSRFYERIMFNNLEMVSVRPVANRRHFHSWNQYLPFF